MLAALKAVASDAEAFILDACADVQEGNPKALDASKRWQDVLTAIAKAEGRG
jgi:hypothetical protein